MNKEIAHALSECGLSKEDILVYMDLITHGDSTPLSISKNTRIPRTTTYRILDTLRNLGIVSVFKKTILYIMLRKILGASFNKLKKNKFPLSL